MTDEAALMAGILANPADDSPRLQYADWLDEHRQPERAEFIRVQIELANLREPSIKEAIRRVGSAAGAVAYQTNALMAFVQQRDALRRRERELWATMRWSLQDMLAARLDREAGEPDFPAVPNVAIVRRGWVDEVRAPLVTLIGGECRRCEGQGHLIGDPECGSCHGAGRVADPDSEYTDGTMDCPDCDLIDCPACKGQRTLPGILKTIFESQPVTAVRATDREPDVDPYDGGTDYDWWQESEVAKSEAYPRRASVPDGVFALLAEHKRADEPHEGIKSYPSADAAHAALSNALVAHARTIAHIPTGRSA